MLYLGVSQTDASQLNILHALTRKFKLHPDLDLNQIVAACPFHFTGADFYALCADSLLRAMSRKAEEVDEKIGQCSSKFPSVTLVIEYPSLYSENERRPATTL